MTSQDPQLLWHYTNFQALEKIVQPKGGLATLHATHFEYLNDWTEFAEWQHSIEKFEQLAARTDQEWLRSAYRQVLGELGTREHPNYLEGYTQPFIVSLSRRDDDLGQWRAYSTVGGCALGFDQAQLMACFPDPGGRHSEEASLRPCDYGTEIPEGVAVEEPVDDLAAGGPEMVQNILRGFGFDLRRQLSASMSVLKDPAFRAEAEWRVCVAERDDVFARTNAAGELIRCRAVEMGCALRQVMIGPTLPGDRQRKINAVRQLLDSRGFPGPGVSVSHSSAPYRAHL